MWKRPATSLSASPPDDRRALGRLSRTGRTLTIRERLDIQEGAHRPHRERDSGEIGGLSASWPSGSRGVRPRCSGDGSGVTTGGHDFPVTWCDGDGRPVTASFVVKKPRGKGLRPRCFPWYWPRGRALPNDARDRRARAIVRRQLAPEYAGPLGAVPCPAGRIGPAGRKVDPFFDIDLNKLTTGPERGHDLLIN